MSLRFVAAAIACLIAWRSAFAQATFTVNSQATPAATRIAIDNALQAAALSGGIVQFVDPSYDVDGGFLVWAPQGTLHLRSIATPGTRPRIRHVGATHLDSLLRISEVSHPLLVEGLEFDANLSASILLHVSKSGAAGELPTGSVSVRDCVLRNGRQRIWDEGTLDANGIEKKWGHERPTAGVLVQGAFSGVTLQDCLFEDFGHVESALAPNPAWTVASRGAWMDSGGDPPCSTPDAYEERPRRFDVLDCVFRRITSNKFQHLAGGLLVPTDADGLHISALRQASCTEPVVTHRAALAHVRGSTFEQCEYRAIKLQLKRAVVTENQFLRTTNGQCDIDAQWGGAHVTRNTFVVRGPAYVNGAGLVQAMMRSPDPEPFLVADNDIQLEGAPALYGAIGLGSDGPSLSDVVLSGNRILGTPKAFLYVSQTPAGPDHEPTVVGNVVTGVSQTFVLVANPAPGAILRGIYTRNVSWTTSPQTQLGFSPTCWTANKSITHPDVY